MSPLTRLCPHCKMPDTLEPHCTTEQRSTSCGWLRCTDCNAHLRPTRGYGIVTRGRVTASFTFPPLLGDGTPVHQEPDQA